MMITITKKISTLILFFLFSFCAFAQDSLYTYTLSEDKSEILFDVNLDLKQLHFEDSLDQEIGAPAREAIILPIEVDMNSAGTWIDLPNSQKVWKLTIKAPGSYGLIVSYNDFYIPEGGELFVYNEDNPNSVRSYANGDNPLNGFYTTETLSGDKITLEYLAPSKTKELPRLLISDIGYKYSLDGSIFSLLSDPKLRLNAALSCQVNVNCPEGDNWRNQIKGILKARIRTAKSGNTNYYAVCSASLVNNTNEDGAPYVLTAAHCVGDLDQIQYSQFHFFYEFSGCENETVEPNYKVLSGCKLLAQTPMNGGTDGALLEITQPIPADWDVYYNGWDLRDEEKLFDSGVVIHHARKDVKKISTFEVPLGSTTWRNGSLKNGSWHIGKFLSGGVEKGSSGSSAFNSDGLIIGTTIGGSLSCEGSATIGKMAYHWDKNADPNNWMKPYLDPQNRLHLFSEDGLRMRGMSSSDLKNKSSVLTKTKKFTAKFLDNNLKVESSSYLIKTIEVYDLSGNMVYSNNKVNNLSININTLNWTSGFYIIKTNILETGAETQKVLKVG